MQRLDVDGRGLPRGKTWSGKGVKMGNVGIRTWDNGNATNFPIWIAGERVGLSICRCRALSVARCRSRNCSGQPTERVAGADSARIHPLFVSRPGSRREKWGKQERRLSTGHSCFKEARKAGLISISLGRRSWGFVGLIARHRRQPARTGRRTKPNWRPTGRRRLDRPQLPFALRWKEA